eukprot:gnl/Hemi2/3514_TR1221_c0_g1_i1.p1 gnl/Hemi2/3514_TR1221_c0_g1~~gnl/Hemi2/3514_TR1221_c0_g1_i1.p1  ORF type:complete len:103 (-),score=22.80 gnl/Hemi2/3514_TR1221_c0_g1_i1:298-582(-)
MLHAVYCSNDKIYFIKARQWLVPTLFLHALSRLLILVLGDLAAGFQKADLHVVGGVVEATALEIAGGGGCAQVVGLDHQQEFVGKAVWAGDVLE